MKNIFLYFIWIIYILGLFISPITDFLSYLLIAIVATFSSLYIVEKNGLNFLFLSKYVLKTLMPLILIIFLAGLYGQFKIFFYLSFSLLSCWMGFLLGNRTHILPVRNFYYPFVIIALLTLGISLEVNTTFSSIISILLLVPWFFYSKNFLLFWIYSSFISFITFSRALIMAVFFTINFFYINKILSFISIILATVLLIIIFSNTEQFFIFWNQTIQPFLIVNKGFENSRGQIWGFVIDNLYPGTSIFGQSNYIPYDAGYGAYSSHNGFLQAFIKLGLPGLILLLSTLILIIKKYINNQSIYAKILVSITFLYFIREIFEVTLIENLFYIAGFYWFIVGILFRKIEEENESKNIK